MPAEYYYIVIGVVVVFLIMVLASIFFQKVKFTKDSIELQKEEPKNDNHELKEKLHKVNEIFTIVEQKAFEAGYEVGKTKYKTILEAQRGVAEEQMIPLREKVMNTLCLMSHSKHETDGTIFLSIVTLYFNIFMASIKTSFELNNWRRMSQVEFDDMINRKINLLLSEWKRVVNIYYVSKVASVPQSLILGILEDPNNLSLNQLFTDTIKTIFTTAKRMKISTEDKTAEIEKQMHLYNDSIIKASLSDENDKKPSEG
jgi:hypothetical protein